MKFDGELAELAKLLRIGAETARTIADERGQDQAAILELVVQAESMAAALDRIVGDESIGEEAQLAASLRLRRDR